MFSSTNVSLTAAPVDPCISSRGCQGSLLTFLRGWQLTSTAAAFGGLSGLTFASLYDESLLLAVGDHGIWAAFPAAPPYEGQAELASLRDGEGQPLTYHRAYSADGMPLWDAEGITRR